MRIGVYAEAPSANGGVFRYTLTMLQMLRALDLDHDVVVLHRRGTDLPVSTLAGPRWRASVLPTRAQDVLRRFAVATVGDEWARRMYHTWSLLREWRTGGPPPEPPYDRRGARWYTRRVDLTLFPVYCPSAFEMRIPAVVTVHDLNHRVYTEFPELHALGEYARREYYFENACRFALAILVESETGREDVLNYYGGAGLQEERVVVLPMLPAPWIRTPGESEVRRACARHGLASGFLFYPAQFWPHKNHVRLVEALQHLKRAHGLTPTLVLGGSHSGWLRERTFAQTMRRAYELGVANQVRYLGFIPDDDMAGLYGAAAGLAMPTFFGPTNIPVLEAFAVGCPVLTSDIRGIREQTAGAAILVNPRSPEAIAEGLRRLLTSTEERTTLVNRGRELIGRYTPADYQRILRRVVEDAAARVSETWPHLAAAEPHVN